LRRRILVIMKKVAIVCFLSLLLAGCKSSYLAYHTSGHWDSQVSSDVMEAWRKHMSYYALVEIIDTYVNPWCNPATKEEVREYLGQGDEGPDGYPGAGPDCWVYTSVRKVPYGSYCIIHFGKDGKVDNIEWVSE
jgi:hypothetical protein